MVKQPQTSDTIMSGYDCQNRSVFTFPQNTVNDEEGVMSSGRLKQKQKQIITCQFSMWWGQSLASVTAIRFVCFNCMLAMLYNAAIVLICLTMYQLGVWPAFKLTPCAYLHW